MVDLLVWARAEISIILEIVKFKFTIGRDFLFWAKLLLARVLGTSQLVRFPDRLISLETFGHSMRTSQEYFSSDCIATTAYCVTDLSNLN